MATVNIIAPKVPQADDQQENRTKRRVAAYARVSTEQDEQQSSYEAQMDYYTKHILCNPDWSFVKIYSDEGISGTNTKKRDGFNEMMQDALDGKIDLILTKSISRFARNTVDALVSVRKLKEKGVEVYFEKENIYTLDAKGEMLITIMSSLAQEESRSISENVTWGKRKSMADGKVCLPYKSFLGYEKGEDGNPKIVESEAKIVRQIYTMFLQGKTLNDIGHILDDQSVPTPRGGKHWSATTIASILRNEKYKGEALLQKTFTADFLTKKIKKNEGELPKYHIQGSHPAIIPPETFDLVQSELARRGTSQRNSSPFANKIVCEECGSFYGRKVWHSNDASRSQIWFCNHMYNDTKCTSPRLRESQIEQAFAEALNKIMKNKKKYIEHLNSLIVELTNPDDINRQMQEADAEYDRITGRLKRMIDENSMAPTDQDEYRKRFNTLATGLDAAENRITSLKTEAIELSAKRERIRLILDKIIKSGENIYSFDLSAWSTMVDKVVASPKQTLIFHFRDGSKVTIKVPTV